MLFDSLKLIVSTILDIKVSVKPSTTRPEGWIRDKK